MNKGHTIPVLDHGHVIYVDHLGSDLDICEAARVSYKHRAIPQRTDEDNRRLLAYLWRNRHTSPFEMGKVVLNIKMPIFVARQYVRHRMQNMNEVSARYTELPAEFYIPQHWRFQDPKNKQASIKSGNWNPIVDLLDETSATVALQEFCQGAYTLYQMMLASGIAREMARMVLPLNIYTEVRACWDLKNLLHFITLREDAHAQAEIQEYGRAIKMILMELFPMTMEAYKRYSWVCQDLQTQESTGVHQ